jgi:hypothetical protein
MARRSKYAIGGLSIVFGMAVAVSGCGHAGSETARQSKNTQKKSGSQAERAKGEEKKGHDHEGWWCDEHGVPEEVCGQCNVKLAAEFQRKGDWCNDHDRPKSQCFKCDPKLRDRFAAQYRAKYGKEPPPIEDDDKPAQKNEKQG